jgi:hypothetical protein
LEWPVRLKEPGGQRRVNAFDKFEKHEANGVALGLFSRVSKRGAAQVMSTFKNLTIGIFELEKERGRTKANRLTVWSRRLKARKVETLSAILCG